MITVRTYDIVCFACWL